MENERHFLPFNNEGKVLESTEKTPEQRKKELDQLTVQIDQWCDELRNENK